MIARLARLEDTERDLEQQVDRLGLRDAVHVFDFQQDVASVYAALSMSSVPRAGDREVGQPVLEGQAHGLAVIATGAGMGAGIVDDGVDGLIVRSGDERALVSALIRLGQNATMRRQLGRQARQKAESEYAQAKVANRVYELYGRAQSSVREARESKNLAGRAVT